MIGKLEERKLKKGGEKGRERTKRDKGVRTRLKCRSTHRVKRLANVANFKIAKKRGGRSTAGLTKQKRRRALAHIS